MDTDSNLAFVKVDANNLPTASVGLSADLQLGQRIIIVSKTLNNLIQTYLFHSFHLKPTTIQLKATLQMILIRFLSTVLMKRRTTQSYSHLKEILLVLKPELALLQQRL